MDEKYLCRTAFCAPFAFPCSCCVDLSSQTHMPLIKRHLDVTCDCALHTPALCCTCKLSFCYCVHCVMHCALNCSFRMCTTPPIKPQSRAPLHHYHGIQVMVHAKQCDTSPDFTIIYNGAWLYIITRCRQQQCNSPAMQKRPPCSCTQMAPLPGRCAAVLLKSRPHHQRSSGRCAQHPESPPVQSANEPRNTFHINTHSIHHQVLSQSFSDRVLPLPTILKSCCLACTLIIK